MREPARHTGAELAHPLRMTGHATVSCGRVSARQVVQHHAQAVGAQQGGQMVGCVAVGKLALDRLEAAGAGRGEPIGEGQLGEERAEVG
ncbi:hypothetical protein D9M68_845110 [compost metagenome]